MNSDLLSQDGVNLCYKDTCIKARGENAKLIVTSISLAIILLGVAHAVKSL